MYGVPCLVTNTQLDNYNDSTIYHMSSCMYFIPEFDNVFFVIFNFLIVYKTSFLDFHVRGCDIFKGDYSLSSVFLAGNVYSLEEDDAGSDDVPIDSESEL